MKLSKDSLDKLVTEKLEKYIGDNIKLLLDREDQKYTFSFINGRVYYLPEKLRVVASHLPSKEIVSFGVCFGKISKSNKFKLHITALDFLAPYAKYKIWLKPNAEQQFLYGNHVLKSGIARISENCPQYGGVVIYNMQDVPLGFGVSAKSTSQIRTANPLDIVAFHQSDLGEYLRSEDIYL